MQPLAMIFYTYLKQIIVWKFQKDLKEKIRLIKKKRVSAFYSENS